MSSNSQSEQPPTFALRRVGEQDEAIIKEQQEKAAKRKLLKVQEKLEEKRLKLKELSPEDDEHGSIAKVLKKEIKRLNKKLDHIRADELKEDEEDEIHEFFKNQEEEECLFTNQVLEMKQPTEEKPRGGSCGPGESLMGYIQSSAVLTRVAALGELLEERKSEASPAELESTLKLRLIEFKVDEGNQFSRRSFALPEAFYTLLMDHQKESLRWLLHQSIKGRGSILADEMGLGKTIQAIALIITQQFSRFIFSEKRALDSSISPILVVCPATVISQWKQELEQWFDAAFYGCEALPIQRLSIQVYSSSTKSHLKGKFPSNSIVVTSYDQIRIDADVFELAGTQIALPWTLIVMDEAQKIKNSSSQIHLATLNLHAEQKLILTGTPIENSLNELFNLFNFVEPGVLGDASYFEKHYCKVIMQGGMRMATPKDKALARSMIKDLKAILKEHILRRTKKQLRAQLMLPERNEFMVPCQMTDSQVRVYAAYLRDVNQILEDRKKKGNRILRHGSRPQQDLKQMTYVIMGYLRKICNHPMLFFERLFDREAYMNAWTYNFKQLRQTPEYQTYTKLYLKDKPGQIKIMGADPENEFDIISENDSTESDMKEEDFIKDGQAKASLVCFDNSGMSAKVNALFQMLADWKKENEAHPEQTPNKALVYSQTKKMLSLFERMARARDYSYLRMDGGVKVEDRQDLINQFNGNPDLFMFLMTTRVGGLGINLKSANKVVIFDLDWNPMVDIQATDRALRIGQKRDVMIYRLFIDDSVEEKVYHRQIFKKFISDSVLHNPSNSKVLEQENLSEFLEIPESILQRDNALAEAAEANMPKLLDAKMPELVPLAQTKEELEKSTDQFSSKCVAFNKRTEKELSKLKESCQIKTNSKKELEQQLVVTILQPESDQEDGPSAFDGKMTKRPQEESFEEFTSRIKGNSEANAYLDSLKEQGSRIRQSLQDRFDRKVKEEEEKKKPQPTLEGLIKEAFRLHNDCGIMDTFDLEDFVKGPWEKAGMKYSQKQLIDVLKEIGFSESLNTWQLYDD